MVSAVRPCITVESCGRAGVVILRLRLGGLRLGRRIFNGPLLSNLEVDMEGQYLGRSGSCFEQEPNNERMQLQQLFLFHRSRSDCDPIPHV
jgi:hypothetical protein